MGMPGCKSGEDNGDGSFDDLPEFRKEPHRIAAGSCRDVSGRGGRVEFKAGSGCGGSGWRAIDGIGTGAGGVSGLVLFSAGDPSAVIRELRHAYALVQVSTGRKVTATCSPQ